MSAIALDFDTEWKSSQALMHSLIRKMLKHSGGDYDELQSEAYFAFVEAWNSFSAEQGTKFSTWLYHKVRGRLLEHIRTRARKWKRTENDISLEASEIEVGALLPPLADVMDELSEDGRMLASLIIQSPLAIQADLNPRSMLKSLSCFMSENYGWTAIRAAITFSEISDALN